MAGIFSKFFGKKEEVALSWWQRLKGGLLRTSSRLTSGLTELFTHKKLDASTLEGLEDLLIEADFGLDTAAEMTLKLKSTRFERDITAPEVKAFLREEIIARLTPVAVPFTPTHKPHIVLVCGVNGVGKTTTIGKMAAKFAADGKKVTLCAGDTFRAAAIEQLHIWAERTGSEIISRETGADAASLAFDGLKAAIANNSDILLIDTAGRLQNKSHLMDELAKIIRVLKKAQPDAPHDVLLVLDATTGQNALKQAEVFREIVGVTGLIMTKLDGTARGGILVALAAKFKLPVHYIGVGEQIDDLEAFNPEDYAKAILGADE
jgi:fused signal recognition particle receptor